MSCVQYWPEIKTDIGLSPDYKFQQNDENKSYFFPVFVVVAVDVLLVRFSMFVDVLFIIFNNFFSYSFSILLVCRMMARTKKGDKQIKAKCWREMKRRRKKIGDWNERKIIKSSMLYFNSATFDARLALHEICSFKSMIWFAKVWRIFRNVQPLISLRPIFFVLAKSQIELAV